MKLDTYIREKIPHPIEFNPKDIEHMTAYYKLKYKGKQGPLRFNVPRPFNNVIAVMEHSIAQHHITTVTKLDNLDFTYGYQL
jgi:hypothetical protein